jgi:low temperature requirement protein LtrA
VPIGWAWAGFTFYANRFDPDDIAYRLLKAGGMLGIASVAITVHSLFHGGEGSVTFAVSYAFTRVCLIALYARARRHVEGLARRLVDVYLSGFTAGAAIWLLSIAVPEPARYYLWALALCVELSMPLLVWRMLGGGAVNAPHLTERYGGFFIIVLGESVVAVVASVAGTRFTTAISAVAVAAFVIALCVGWIYFDLADTSGVGRGVLGLVYVYAHFPLLAGVAAVGAAAKVAITDGDAPSLGAGPRWVLAGGLACYLLSLAVLHIAAEWTSMRDRAFLGRLVCSAVALALAAAGASMRPIVFVGLLAAMLVAQLVLELLTFPEGAASVVPPPAPAPAQGGAIP